MNNQLITTTADAIELIESGLADQEQVLEAIEFKNALGKLYRDMAERLEAAALAWIEKNGEIWDGTRHVYAKPNSTIKCTSVKRTLEAVLTKTGGDLEAVVECLSSDAFKQGATRKLLGDDADGLFVEKVTSKLKDEGGEEKVQVRLQDFDSKVLEGKR